MSQRSESYFNGWLEGATDQPRRATDDADYTDGWIAGQQDRLHQESMARTRREAAAAWDRRDHD